MKTTVYKNSVKSKLNNRRIAVFKHNDNNEVFIEISLFDKTNHNKRSCHQVRRNSIVDTGVLLSEEAAIALTKCLMNYFSHVARRAD